MKLGDIIALAKMGFKKEDIDRYLSMETAADPDSTEPESPAKETGAGEPEERSPEPEPQPEPEKTADHDTSEQIKALEDQITDLKKQLENAQKQNVQKNNSGGYQDHSDQDVLNDIVRNFM